MKHFMHIAVMFLSLTVISPSLAKKKKKRDARIAYILKNLRLKADVQEKFKTVGLPLIKEFLSYRLESMRLKAETLAKIICIFAPELEPAVDAIFETAPKE